MAENYERHVIPQNATDTGKILNGLVKKRNLIEAVIITLPFAALGYYLYPVMPKDLKGLAIIPAACSFIFGIFGIPPYSLLEFVNMAFKFSKTKHYAKHNPRLKWEDTPEFLINSPYISIIDTIMKFFENISNSNIEEKNPIDENIYNPKHVEKFKDDPDAKKSRRELIAEEKALKKRLKQKIRERKKAAAAKNKRKGR